MKIDFITSNPLKLRIANEALEKYDVLVRQRKVELKELQSFDIEEVALDKARQAMIGARRPFIVSDDGFYIDALDGFPGALLKYVVPKVGDDKLLRLVGRQRGASFVNVIVKQNHTKFSLRLQKVSLQQRQQDHERLGGRLKGYLFRKETRRV